MDARPDSVKDTSQYPHCIPRRSCCDTSIAEYHADNCPAPTSRRIKVDEKGRPEKEPELVPEVDVVEKPSHYARWVIEPLKFIMANGFEFWRGNIVKYACRAGYKTYDGLTPEQSEITDLKKVIQYAKVRIEELEGVS